MRTSWKKLTIIALTIAILVGGVTAVFAQDEGPTPPFGQGIVDEDGDGVCDICGQVPRSGFGMMGGYGMGGAPWAPRGAMGGNAIIALLADKLELTVPVIQAELADGLSIAQLAANYDLSAEALLEEVLAARETALQTAIDAGWLTQEQVDLMLAHMAEELSEHINEPWSGPGGYGYGRGHCQGGAFGQSSGFGGMRPGGGRFGGGMMRGFGANSSGA